MQAIGGQFHFAPVYHCIEQADGGISRKFFHAYVLFRKNTFVQQFGTFGPFQQRMLRSMPMAAVKEGDVWAMLVSVSRCGVQSEYHHTRRAGQTTG